MYLWCWDDLADKKKVVDFRSPVAGLGRKWRGVERIPGNSFERKYGCKTVAILHWSTSFKHRGNYGSTTSMKRGATRQELVVAAGVRIHRVAARAERNFVVHQLHEASREPKMRLMADLMNPAKEEAVVAPHTRVLESLRAFIIHMNPEAASPHGHVDEPAEEEHEQQLLQAAAPVNLIKCPAAHRFTHEPYHDIHELHHDAHDIDTPGAPAAATGKKIVFKSWGSAFNVKHAHDEMR
jgi:hypothetical protein